MTRPLFPAIVRPVLTMGGAVLAGLVMASAAMPAAAQAADVDRIERVPGAGAGPSPRRNEAVRVVKPGALLFASFDRNFDGVVTADEVDLGAAGSFRAADKNGDGVISGFEQSDWATAVGGANDVIANPMQFDLDLDRSVTPVEFAAGLKRIADTLVDSSSVISFTELVKAIRPSGAEQADRGAGRGAPFEPEPVTR